MQLNSIVIGLLVCLTPLAATGKERSRQRVWIDTDPALGRLFHDADDAFALVQALHSPELEIVGVSVGRGNTSVENGTRIAREIVARCGAQHGVQPPIFAGHSRARKSAAPSEAALALRVAARTGRLTYLAFGPLTNLAEFLDRFPAEKGRIARVIFLGGQWPGTTFRAGPWNSYRFSDANFVKDPAAAARVLAAGIPVTLVPIDVARGIGIAPAEMRALRRSDGCPQWVARKAGLWFLSWRVAFGVSEAPAFDAAVVLAATHPPLLQTRAAAAHIDSTRRPRLVLGSRGTPVRAATGLAPTAQAAFLQSIAAGRTRAIRCACPP